ncbi:hypothetical protein VKT23_019144 [Stygiomarasmius scandens]|uniref:Uncharacterized protein n=1 Tax=Marasmiellus scandens TaxID=2682957 RepID=A0ABR1IPD1_9AGAR
MDADAFKKLGPISRIQLSHEGPRDAHLVGRYHSAERRGALVINPLLQRMQPGKGFKTTYTISEFDFPNNIQISFGMKFDDVDKEEYLWMDDDYWYHVDYESKEIGSITFTKDSKLEINSNVTE